MSRFHKTTALKLLRNFLLISILAAWQIAFAISPLIHAGTAHAAPVCTVDTAGANDEPNQKDLTKLCIDYAGQPASVQTTWNWDDKGSSGANTLDACSLFDTDGDGNANYSVCVTTTGTTAVLDTVTSYSCGDAKNDRCTQTTTVIPNGTTSCTVGQTTDDPFPADDFYPIDTQAACTIDLSTVGGLNAKLIDVCSYPSGEPNSDPSDCVIAQPRAGKLQVVKHLVPTTDGGLFNLQIDSTTEAANVSNNGTTGVVVVPEGNHDVGETAGTSTSLASYNSAIECRDLNGTGTVVTSGIGTTLDNVPVPDGSDIICTITNTVKQATLILQKTVINDNGGTLTQSNFPVAIGGTTAQWGSNSVSPGTYTVSETQQTGYQAGSWGGDCTSGGSVTLTPGQTATCSITNDDIAPQLTVIKHVVNDNGGTATASNFTMNVAGTNVSHSSFAGAESPGTTVTLNAGSYSVDESIAAGYSKTLGTDCSGTIAIGETKTCTITNDDIAPSLTVTKVVVNPYGTALDPSSFPLAVDGISVTTGVATTQFNAGSHTVTEIQQSGYTLTGVSGNCTQANNIISLTLSIGGTSTCTLTNTAIQPKLTVIKHVVNDNGGNKTAGNFTMNVTGTNVSSSSFAGAESPGTTVTLNEGSYSVDEGSHTGYTETMSGDCDSTIAIGQTKTCTITNNDIAPTLKLVKQVTNTNGGTKTPADWTLTASGSGGFSDTGDSTTFHAVTANVNYALSESTVPGYAAGSWSCDGGAQVGSNVALSPGQNVTCTITNSDVAATLTLVKTVVDNNGGTKTVNDFQGKIDGNNVAWATAISLSAGAHTASEVNLPGYSAGSWGGDCAADGSITLANAQNATCTITNDDVAPSLTLNKIVSNTHGGTAIESDWTLTATGPSTLSGQGATGNTDVISDSTFKAGTYSLSESGSPTGYAASDWTCTNNVTVTSSQITLANGQSTVCSITNSDIAPSLTVTKVVVNPYGTALDPSSFPLAVDGITVTSGVPTTQFNAGSHTVTETQHSGYTLTGVSGNCSQSNNTINLTLSVGGTSTCTLTNTAIQPKLTVIKHVINDNSGTSSASDFTMTVTGNSIGSLSFAGDENGTTVGLNEGAYTVGETSHVGYAETFSGDCNSTISIGGTKTCTITNNDIPNPGIHIVKSGPSVAHEGDKVTYNFTVTNTGDIALSNVTVDDNVAGGAVYQFGDTNGNHMLDTNETWTFTKDYTIPTPQIADVVNTAEACGDFSDGTTSGTDVCDSDSHTLDVLHPAISVEKFGPNTAFAGDTVTYEFDVTNTGDTPLSGLTVNDNVAGAGTFTGGDTNSNGMLDLGETWIYTKRFTIPSNQTSDITNTVTACGSDSLQLQDCDTDDHTTTVLNPGIHVVKTGPSSAAAGSTVTYTFTVTNTGNTSLDSIAVNDNIAGAGVYQSGDTNGNSMLDTTETWIYTAQYNIPANQFNSVTNTVTACGSTTTDNEIELEVADLNNSKTVCAQDSHTLVIPKVLAEVTPPQLVNTGEPAILSVIAGLITISLVAGLSLATKQNKR